MARLLSLVCTLLLVVQAFAEVHFTWPYWIYKSVPHKPPKLQMTKSAEAAEPGLLFLGPKNNHVEGMLLNGSTATIYDQDGNLIFYGPDMQTTNLRVQTLFGKPVLTFWSGMRVDLGYGYGAVHILDQTYREIYTIKLQGNFVTPTGEPEDSYIDLHESQITDRNTIIVTSYNLTRIDVTAAGGTANAWVLKSQFHEIDIATNALLFSWSPLDHLAKFPPAKGHNPVFDRGITRDRPWDIYHINSVDATDSGYVVSLRFFFSAFYINKDGSVRWQLEGQTGGDFDLCATCNFSWQHDIRVYDETPNSLTMSIFNNAGTPIRTGTPSTGLLLGVDLRNMTVSNKRTLIDPNELIETGTQGSVQVLGGNTTGNVLVGYGSWATVKEYNSAGMAIFTMKFGPDAQIASYRSFKFDWHATPHWNPDVYAAKISPNSTSVSMSWNGATDYDQWAVYGGHSPDEFDKKLLTTVARTGFETTTVLDSGTANFLQVIPMQAGRDLGYSTIVEVSTD